MRDRGYYREVRANAIARKQRISESYWHVKCPGVLDKGKIHCSCWMCTGKSRYLGRPISEQRRCLDLQDELVVCDMPCM